MPRLARLAAVEADPFKDHQESRVPRLRTRYYAFLSYSHQDKALADWLHRELEKFRVPHSIAGKLTANGVVPKRLTPIFRDQHDLSAGGDLAEEIKAALAASQFLVVLCSPTAARSRWTNQEIESFKRTRPEGCVLAAIVAGEPFASDKPGREDQECFPPALRYKYDRRGRATSKRAEPMAADFRVGAEGQRLAFLKLVAGMLGVGLDELVRRAQTRRHRHLAWLAAASVGGMTVTSTLAATAFHARNEAREQRRQAEKMVEFMVGDLRAKLEPIGKLDVLDGVGSRVLAYYSKQDTSDLSDDALIQRSQALNLMGQVAYLRGHYEEADGLYRQALAGTAEALRRSPNDTKRLFDHAQNVFWLGEVARFRGQNDKAEADYREYKRLADRLVALEPDNLKWRMEALYGTEDVGIALYNQRRFEEAARQFESTRRPMENLIAIQPTNRTYPKELSKVFAWLADARKAQGNLQAATSLREQQIALLDHAVAAGANDVDYKEYLIPAHEALGSLLAMQGQWDRAIAELQAAIAQADALIPTEPSNTTWKDMDAAVRLDLARTFLAAGKVAEAAQQTNAACAIAGALHSTGGGSSRATRCLLMRTHVALRAGADAQAMDSAQQALASARSEHGSDPIRDRYHVPVAWLLLGDARQKAGNLEGAKAAWSNALAAVPRGVAETPFEMDQHAAILERLGRTDEARQLVSRLDRAGYHRLT